MMRLSVLLLLIVAAAGIALGPANGVLACGAPATGLVSGGGEAAPEETQLPVIEPEAEARIVVRQPESSSATGAYGPFSDGEAATMAFAAAALAAPAFAAVSLALARGRVR
ncbi:MAG: hypothetical protein U5Q44_15165 [Dehalococcoidia bacterium]|nr:hypothetical protein [Dehalococcoidia bacterium]